VHVIEQDRDRQMNLADIQEVLTGEVKVGSPGTVLIVSALGSCVAVVVQDRRRRTGGIAHVMLPGKAAPSKTEVRHRYAEDSVSELLERLCESGSEIGDLTVCVAGGANVLERQDDTICSRNIASVTGILEEKGLDIAASSLGGTLRRRVRLDIERGQVLLAVGDGGEQVLWQPCGEGTPVARSGQ
jgi:chemotaxis protein CheD